MLISLNWLKEYIDLNENVSVKEIENALTMIGQEVEKIEVQGKNLDKVLVSKIVKYEKNPELSNLSICQVDNGSEILQVVCGAPNHKEGDKVAMAQIGAKLSEDFVIKKAKIRGIESNGMLCSEVELGIGNDADGIIILKEDAPLGMPLNKYLGLSDTIFELEITPNRADCLSHIGIARELSAHYNLELKYPISSIKVEDENNFKVDIKDNLSNRYMARVIKNVKVSTSPEWLVKRLEAVGIRSVNNLVDISNYVMLEFNQPSHIFDISKLKSNNISVENAKNDEKFLTLDEKERILKSNDIVIKNDDKIIALAGIMGGKDTEVDFDTKDILIEVAHFDNISIRKTSRRLAISSEASYRFERNIDVISMGKALDRLTSLIVNLCGGTVSEVVDNYPLEVKTNVCEFSFERMNRFIGKVIEKEKVLEIFKLLEIKVVDKGDILILEAPSHRNDLINQFDYFEEIIRIYRFDNIENVMPKVEISNKRNVDTTEFNTNIKLMVSKLGLREVINYSFIPKNALEKIKYTKLEKEDIIEIKNPITEDFVILRPTLMYSLIKNVKDNFNRSISNIRIFEVSKRFEVEKNSKLNDAKYVYLNDRKILENETLAITLAGSKNKDLFNPKPEKYNFYDLKGIVEAIFKELKFSKYQLRRSENNSYHPGRSVDIFVGRELIGSFGEIHPDLLENMDVEKVNIIYAEIYLDKVKKYISNKNTYRSVSKFQKVERDIAVVVREEILVGEMIKSIEKIDKLVEKIELFDIYRGNGVEIGYKSVALSIEIQDDNKTLEEKEINELMNKIILKLEKEYGAKLRI